ncbi:protein swallow [Drosophila grimshawi]|uniref:GH24711 n=1 Tax=Drosophila grimshawi TaxID=7222 RepID=B4JMY3_DROGR|nr:protein swallow [Drosophila grimshawi]EDV92076.1 GH24711 [Drosophila grimshawi]
MSLEDESFPADELFDKLNARQNTSNLQRQYSFSLNLDEADNFERGASQFLNSSENTCASDPVGLHHADNKHDNNKANNECEDDEGASTHPKLGSERSSKAVSYQDIHSAYTKRRYKHVTSKVRKYIRDLDEQAAKQPRNPSNTFQRHRSMPESLTQAKLNDDESMSTAHSSEADTNTRDESFERLSNEKDTLQMYNDFLEARLSKKSNDHILLRRNFESVRTELTDCKDKLKRLSSDKLAASNDGRSFLPTIYGQPSRQCVAKATQTDLPPLLLHTVHIFRFSDMPDIPAIAANATPQPHPNCNLTDITLGSSVGSTELPMLNMSPAARRLHLQDFINDGAQLEANAIASNDGVDFGVNLPPTSSNRLTATTTTTNNWARSDPSSNDSAIEVDQHGTNSSTSTQIEITGLHLDRRRKSLASRILLRLFGPCARCSDPNHTLDEIADSKYMLMARPTGNLLR